MGYCTGLEQLGEPVASCTKLSFHTHPLLHCLGEILLLRVSPNLSLKKKQHFVENFCWTRLKKIYLLSGAARLGDIASIAVLDIHGWQLWMKGLVRRKKILKMRLMR